MSQTPDTNAPAPGPAPEDENSFFTSIRTMGISRPADRWVGGVASAVARRLDIDPLIVRVVLVASVFVVGIGLVLYGLAWALLPEESDGRIHAQELGRGNSDVALLGAGAFVLAGLTTGGRGWTLATWWNGAGFGWVNGVMWLAVVGVVVAIIVSSSRQSGSSPGGSSTASAAMPPPPAAQYANTPSAPATQAFTPPPAPPSRPAPVPAPAAPPKPVVPGAGARFFAVCAGLSLLVLAGLLLADRSGLFTGPVALTALGATTVIFGAGIIVAGLTGRSSGVLGFIAVVSLILSGPVAATSDVGLSWSAIERWDAIGESHHTPSSVAETTGGYALGVGDLRVDLTALDVPAGETVDLALNGGVGDVELFLPADGAARVTVALGAGEAAWDVDGSTSSSSGLGVRRVVTNLAANAGEDLVFDVTVNLGLGNITIVQED